jgi:hypothetical protein
MKNKCDIEFKNEMNEFDSDKIEVDWFNCFNEAEKWKLFMSEMKYDWHSVRISHTDQDMLTMAFKIKFSKPTPLENKALLEELFDTLESLQKSELL